jgi:hypothetical protein
MLLEIEVINSAQKIVHAFDGEFGIVGQRINLESASMDDQEKMLLRFTKILEEAIRHANHEVIDPMLPPINVKTVLPIAVMVAKLRGRYLQAAFELVDQKTDGMPTDEQIDKLRAHRVAFEEVMAASQALETAISRGYLELASE